MASTPQSLLGALLAVSALMAMVRPARAQVITNSWTVVGCDTGPGGTTFGGNTIQQIYAGASSYAANAQTQISVATSASKIVPLSDAARAANNAWYMWGTPFKFAKKVLGNYFGSSMPSASQTTLNSVSSEYSCTAATITSSSSEAMIPASESPFVVRKLTLTVFASRLREHRVPHVRTQQRLLLLWR
jgi:hypothetical protein